MKGIFMVSDAGIMASEAGISKKIRCQINAMNDAGIECELYVQSSGRENMPRWFGKLLYLLPFSNVTPKWEYKSEFAELDFVYFRRPISMTFAMRRFIKKCKKKNSKIKFYMEIPTYPYDLEYSGMVGKYMLTRDKLNRGKIRGLIECMFVIDPMKLAENLYGVKAIRFMNGYDVKSTQVRQYRSHGNDIILTCVGILNFWHGYERLLHGLGDYYDAGGNRKIYVEIVGDGPELPLYKKICTERGLDDYVSFHGKLYGEALDRIYDRTDIGFASLGRYKSGVSVIGDLKTREYITKGIPVVSGCTVDVFADGNSFEFYKEIPNCSLPVDIHEIIKFYDFIRGEREKRNIEEYMHEFALDKFDISQTMKPIFSEIKRG